MQYTLQLVAEAKLLKRILLRISDSRVPAVCG